MAVDFEKKPAILVIHGVQTGDDTDQRQHKNIQSTLEKLLSSPDLHLDEPLKFTTDMFKYEDINDDASYLMRRVLSTMTGNAISGWVVDKAVDLVGDVLLALSEGDAYEQIKNAFTDRIMGFNENGMPVYVVAHSLGSFYALEVLNDLFEGLKFAENDKTTWPVHGLITIGSPLGLEIFKRSVDTLNRRSINVSVKTKPRFTWKNYWDRQDPIVTGSILGYPKENNFPLRFDRQSAKKKGWSIRSDEVNSGTTAHLAAHTSYWHSPTVGQGIVNMLYADRENN
jgi:hypothetical protein